MGNDTSKVEEIVDLIKNDDFCSFASQIAENEAIIKDSDDYGRTLLWVSFKKKNTEIMHFRELVTMVEVEWYLCF